MSIETIPEYRIRTCDVCHKNDDKHNEFKASFKRNGILRFNKSALGSDGNAIADESESWDVCDDCIDKVLEAINGVGKRGA